MTYINNFILWLGALIGVWNGQTVSNTTRWGLVLLAVVLAFAGVYLTPTASTSNTSISSGPRG